MNNLKPKFASGRDHHTLSRHFIFEITTKQRTLKCCTLPLRYVETKLLLVQRTLLLSLVHTLPVLVDGHGHCNWCPCFRSVSVVAFLILWKV